MFGDQTAPIAGLPDGLRSQRNFRVLRRVYVNGFETGFGAEIAYALARPGGIALKLESASGKRSPAQTAAPAATRTPKQETKPTTASPAEANQCRMPGFKIWYEVEFQPCAKTIGRARASDEDSLDAE